MDSHLNDIQTATPEATTRDANASWVVRRSKSILALLSGFYLLWLFLPVYYHYGSLHWMERIAAILIFGGALGWAIAVYLEGHKGDRLPPARGLIFIFTVNTCLNMLTRFFSHLFAPFEWPELGIKYEIISEIDLFHGVAGVFAYAVMLQYMHRLSLKNLVLFLLAWYALTSLAAGIFANLVYGFRTAPILHLITPFISSLFYAGLQLFFVSASLFTAWWLAKGARPVPLPTGNKR